MKIKISYIWFTALVLLLTCLFILALLAGEAGNRKLLMVVPNAFGTPDLNTEKLEEFSEEEFLLTYEIRQPSTVQAINSKYSVTLVGTNHNYASLMGYAPLDGGFFTKSAMDSKNKHLVFNETAAFQMFGSNRITGSTLKVNGETWIITGVIQDNDAKNLNLYVPASVTGGSTDSIMVLMDGTITEAYVKNALKSVGIRDNSYSFINLSKSISSISERFSVAWNAALWTLVLLYILVCSGVFMEKLDFYRNRMRELYFWELFAFYRIDFLIIIGGLLAFLAGIIVMLVLSLQILETCLTWQELKPITGELTAGDFGQSLLWLRDHLIIDNILFWIYISLILVGLIFALFRRALPNVIKYDKI